ncbi:MAG TPA: glycosyltransferase [Candidatus Gastranaerophilales bacterium]|nr:glycosyltransferase [Candidatus Gastranaerophilales bacterium]
MPPYKGLAIIIPTRNRAELAKNAINSVLEQGQDDVYVIFSDNSTEELEVEELKSFCDKLNHPNLTYIRSPESMSMTNHWDWAIKYILDNDKFNNITHFLWLADRNVLIKNSIVNLKNIIVQNPLDLISYNFLTLNDIKKPVTISRIKKFENTVKKIYSEDFLYEIYTNVKYPTAIMPLNLISAAPRYMLDRLRQKHNNIFASTSPDACFAYRILAEYDYYLEYDKAINISYALSKSNNYSYMTGEKNDTSKDFASFYKKDVLFPDAMIPEIEISENALINEYCYVAKETNSSKFKKINLNKYFEFLANNINLMNNDKLKKYYFSILKKYGYKPKNKFVQLKENLLNLYLSFRKIFHLRKNFLKMKNFLSGISDNKKIKFYSVQEAIEYINNNL